MTYRISYDQIRTVDDIARTEYYSNEHEALHRARELLETADHEGVAVADSAGNSWGGFRLQLKLGYTPVE
ncbi:MAG TPA: hypothetical protein VGG57_16150 [Stellaceae bacterium]|jgi:hypothetical protein